MLLHSCLTRPLREHPTHALLFADPPTSFSSYPRLPPAPLAAYITACYLHHGTPSPNAP